MKLTRIALAAAATMAIVLAVSCSPAAAAAAGAPAHVTGAREALAAGEAPRRSLLAPKCTVNGCKTCKSGDPSTCEVCGKKMQLIASTGKCECLPGYAGTKKCKRCNSKSVSQGGPLPTAECVPCAKGQKTNAERSECLEPSSWGHWGGDLFNRRWAMSEKLLSTKNAGSLKVKWEADVVGSTSATPTVHQGRVYVPDWEGNVYALDAATGAVVWERKVKDYLAALGVTLPSNINVFPVMSRTSPVVHGDSIILGTMQRQFGGYAYFLALKRDSGDLKWGRLADANVAAVITTSPTLHDGVVYGGVSSLEELVATRVNYTCCTFRGSAIALDAETGAVKWQRYMTPDNGGQPGSWSGAAVWGSSPVVDLARGQVVVTTGDNYEYPDPVEDCLVALGELTAANAPQQKACLQLAGGEANYHNAIVALDIKTGAVKWANPVDGPDAWNAACLSDNPAVNDNCPKVEGPDFDFGQAPVLVSPCRKGLGCRQLLVVGQKSGLVWAVDPADGRVVWKTRAGPGGIIGGHMWGSASDNNYVFVNNNNYGHVTLNLAGADAYLKAVPNTPGATSPPATANGGLITALDAWDGTIKWTFTNPAKDNAGKDAWSLAPVTVANGVVLYASADVKGTLFALGAADGRLLGSYELGASSACGPAVVDGAVYSGTGYSNFALGVPGTKVVALEVAKP